MPQFWKWFAGMVARHLTSITAGLTIVYGGFFFIVQPRAEQFVRQTVAQERFATAKELEQQTEALRDLAARVAQQSDALDEQSRAQTALKTDIDAIKALQRETLRVLLRSERQN